MNTQGLIITTAMDWALGEEEVGKHPPFIIQERFARQFFTQNKVQAKKKKKLTNGNNIRFLLGFYFLKIKLKVPNF